MSHMRGARGTAARPQFPIKLKTVALKERSLGKRAAFLLPSLKLKDRNESGTAIEQDVHRFLIEQFGGYTATVGNLFGYWKDAQGNDSYGEHRLFTVALQDEARLPALKQYLGNLATQMGEECIYFEAGDSVILVYAG